MASFAQHETKTPSPSSKHGGSDISLKFSGGRFLQQVLLEAQRGSNDNNGAKAKRLEAMGFSPEVIQVALHVAAGDEQRAVQLCMSGLSFVGGDGHLDRCAPPAPMKCYICGQKHLTEKSLDIHMKACKKRFERREAKRPPGERRPLLEESELPEGVGCLEQYYAYSPELDSSDNKANQPCNDWPATRPGLVDTSELLPCEFCKRTFAPDRLEKHQRVCVQRPKGEQSTPRHRRSLPGTNSISSPPLVAARAYQSFCQQLERCPGCSRQFRPEVLPAHQKICCPGKRVQTRASKPGDMQPSTPVAKRRARSSSIGSVPYTPPSRFVSPANVIGTSTPSKRSDSGASPEINMPLPSSKLLLESGVIKRASFDDEMRISTMIAQSNADVEVKGIFQVVSATHRTYDALKLTLQEQRDGEAPLEKELWHGTAWSQIPKILKQGFNRSFAGRHGTLLGNATYFSSDPTYSHRFCDRRGGGKDGTKALIVAQVLVGNYCKGCPSDVEPPIMDSTTGDRYDCTVNNEENPFIFAIFRDFQAVPLFLVETKAKTSV